MLALFFGPDQSLCGLIFSRGACKTINNKFNRTKIMFASRKQLQHNNTEFRGKFKCFRHCVSILCDIHGENVFLSFILANDICPSFFLCFFVTSLFVLVVTKNMTQCRLIFLHFVALLPIMSASFVYTSKQYKGIVGNWHTSDRFSLL